MPTALLGVLTACMRCRALVEPLSDEEYSRPPRGHNGLGEHMRHCVDHFLCFFRGLDDGLIDYDARDRNPDLGSKTAVFRQVMDEIVDALENLRPEDMLRTIRIRQLAAPGREPIEIETTIQRELVFLSSHTIHHLAIMSLIAELNGFVVSEGIGVAYSTAAYQARLAQG